MNLRLWKNELMGLAGLISFGMLCTWPLQQFSCYNKHNFDACSENMQNITAVISSIQDAGKVRLWLFSALDLRDM